MREVLREIEVITDIEKVRKIGEKDKEGREVVMISYGEKKRLRDKREWRDDDLTWKKRRVKYPLWMVRREAERLRAEGKRVKVGYKRMWVEGKE